MGFLTEQQLKSYGFGGLGKNIKLSDKACFYNCGNIFLGDNVRIDDFCVLSAGEGGIRLGRHIHIGVGTSLIGKGKITIEDFSNISSRVSIYSSNDDYSGASLTNPTIPEELKNVVHADVFIKRHAIVGAGSVVLPGVTLEEGVAIGALSLISKTCKAFGIYAGIPARRIKDRRRDFLLLERRLYEQ